MELDNTSDEIPSFSLPQRGSPIAPFTLSPEAETVWRQELCGLQRSAPLRRSHSFDELTSQSFTQLDNGSGFTSCDDAHDFCTTCYPCSTSGLDCCNDFWNSEDCFRQVHEPLEQRVTSLKQETDGEITPQPESPSTADVEPLISENEPEENGIENGKIVAGVLLVGLACVVICSMWSLIRLLPLVAIPALCFYRKKFGCQESNDQNLLPKAGKENERRNLPVESVDDITIRERITDLEMRNERLVLELEKQRQTTEALLRQLEDFTSKSYATESKIEKSFVGALYEGQ